MFGGATETGPALPIGFRYRPDLLSLEEERDLVEAIRDRPIKNGRVPGYVGKRRTVSGGWHYDFNQRALRKTDDMPAFLRTLREKAASFAALAPESLHHVLVTEYAGGAGIGWHRDTAVFVEERRYSLTFRNLRE